MSLKLSSRTKALIATFLRSKGCDRLAEFKPQFKDWASDFPPSVKEFFSPSCEELLSSTQDVLDQALHSADEDRRVITEVLGDLLLAENEQDEAKRRGAIFTPHWLARRVTQNCQRHWRRLHRSGKPPSVVADASCGVGSFLYCIEQVFGPTVQIIGVDRDPLSVAFVNLLKWSSKYKWEIACSDSLFDAPHTRDLFHQGNPDSAYQDNFDILIGNPPFVRSSILSRDYSQRIREFYPTTSTGNYDLSVAFVEHALNTLSPGGIASYVLTHKFMTSSYGREICNRLASSARVINIENFQDFQVFPGYTTYTCVLTFAKKPPTKMFTITQFPQGINAPQDPGQGKTASLPIQRLQTHPWDFATDVTHRALRLLRDAKHPLITGIFSGIVQGIRTGANPVYIVPSSIDSPVESDLLLPFVKGEHIRRGSIKSGQLSLIYPYKRDLLGNIVPIDEDEMRNSYPKCWDYLCSKRAILEQRSQDEDQIWYLYSRSQNLDISTRRKLLIREMMPRAEFASDPEGKIAFCSGYALDASHMDDESLHLWTAILCTPTMEFSLRHNGTQLHSGWFRLLKHHLKNVRLPFLTKKQLTKAQVYSMQFRDNPGDAIILRNLDNIVAEAFGLKDEHRKVIKQFLRDCHSRSMKPMKQSHNSIEDHRNGEDPNLQKYIPVRLSQYDIYHRERYDLRRLVTFAPNKNDPIHRWYKYTQGFSGKLVASIISDLHLERKHIVLDPFAGCGTTNLECKKHGIPSIGIDISPLMSFVNQVKTRTWKARELEELASNLDLPAYEKASRVQPNIGIFEDYLRKAFAPKILGQLFCYAREFNSKGYPKRYCELLKMALISIMEDVSQVRKHGSHYRYMLKSENIGLQKLNTQIIGPDSDIEEIFRERLRMMIEDIKEVKFPKPAVPTKIRLGDIRRSKIPDASITAVISSPPYLNRNNYIAQQKAELALLGLLDDSNEYRRLVRSTIRSHVEGDFDKSPVTSYPEVEKIIDRVTLTKNNNPKIPHMIAGYFEDLASTIGVLHRLLEPGGVVALVLGNTRWGGIVVPVDHIIMKIAQDKGFQPKDIFVTRLKGNSPQQMRQFGRIPVRESIVVFHKQQ